MATWKSILNGLGGVEVSNGLEGHIFVSQGAVASYGPAPDIWNTINVTEFGIPVEAKCVDISGILVITMGSVPGWQHIVAAFRTPGQEAIIQNNYCMQAIANTGDGARSNASTTVVLENGKFEWGWHTNGIGLGWPTYASVAINLSFLRYFK